MKKIFREAVKKLGLWLMAFVVLNMSAISVVNPVIVSALSQDDLHSIYNDSVWYKVGGNSQFCLLGEGFGGGNLEGSSGDNSIYKSGLEPPYILEQFMIHILKRLSQKYGQPESNFVTEEHVIALVAFALGEGGDIANQSVFNPMNLGYSTDQIQGIPWGGDGSDGRQAYPSFDIGVEAYARQMSSGYQSRLGFVLSQPDSTAEQFMFALTYYNKFPGNKAWATASLADPAGYYRSRVALVNDVKKNYPDIAGLVIGTIAYEQLDGIRRTDLLTFTNIAGPGNDVDVIVGDISTCSDTGIASGSGLSIVEVAKREYEKNKGILEYGGTILDYTQGGRYPWCASFVSWVYKEAGFPLTRGEQDGTTRGC